MKCTIYTLVASSAVFCYKDNITALSTFHIGILGFFPIMLTEQSHFYLSGTHPCSCRCLNFEFTFFALICGKSYWRTDTLRSIYHIYRISNFSHWSLIYFFPLMRAKPPTHCLFLFLGGSGRICTDV